MYFLSINYHYIDNKEDKYPYKSIYPISGKQLESQLDKISQHFDFISERKLLDAILGKTKLSEMSCLITFDDGLKCQYDKALPILKSKRIPAIFFVNSLPYIDKKTPLVHKIHYLRSQISPGDFLKEIELAGILPQENFLSDDGYFLNKSIETYPYDDPKTSKLKFLLNNVLDIKTKEKVINLIFKRYVADEESFCDDFYMSKEQLLDIDQEEDYSIGTHTHSHYSLSHLPKNIFKKEIERSIKYFKENIGIKNINSISYPYGRFEDVSLDVAMMAESLGMKIGFTTERSFNISLKEPMLFSRMDTNDVIGGKSPMFFFDGGVLKFKKHNIEKRRSFIVE